MQPIANHITILPDPVHAVSKSGIKLVLEEKPFVNSGTVLKVSSDIKDVPLQEGTRIAYLANQEKWQDGHCILNVDHIQAFL